MINIKNIAIFTIGAAVGAGAGALFFKKKYEAFANEEIESVKETFSTRGLRAENQPIDEATTEKKDWKISPEELEGLTREDLKIKMNNKYGKVALEEQVKNGMIKEELDAVNDKEELKQGVMAKSVEQINKENQEKALSRRTKKKDIIDYTKMAKDSKVEDATSKKVAASLHDDMEEMHRISDEYDREQGTGDELTEDEEIMNQSPGDNVPEPEIITSQSFVDEYPDHQKLTLNYYAGDDILVDEDDNPIEDVEIVVGYDSLNHFGEYGPEEDVLYVRNLKFEIDYEIIRLDENYHIEER
ncbi:MAG: hypothetical protein WCS56_00325 [Bacilli bacterium]